MNIFRMKNPMASRYIRRIMQKNVAFPTVLEPPRQSGKKYFRRNMLPLSLHMSEVT